MNEFYLYSERIALTDEALVPPSRGDSYFQSVTPQLRQTLPLLPLPRLAAPHVADNVSVHLHPKGPLLVATPASRTAEKPMGFLSGGVE